MSPAVAWDAIYGVSRDLVDAGWSVAPLTLTAVWANVVVSARSIKRMLDRAHGERAVGHRGTLCGCLRVLREEAGQCLHDNWPDFLKRLHPHDSVAHADLVAAHPAEASPELQR